MSESSFSSTQLRVQTRRKNGDTTLSTQQDEELHEKRVIITEIETKLTKVLIFSHKYPPSSLFNNLLIHLFQEGQGIYLVDHALYKKPVLEDGDGNVTQMRQLQGGEMQIQLHLYSLEIGFTIQIMVEIFQENLTQFDKFKEKSVNYLFKVHTLLKSRA